MQFTILGAGALGSILAAHLRQADHEVELIVRGERARQVSQDGLRLTGLRGIAVAVETVTPHTAQQNPEVLILTCKTYQMEAALASLQNMKPKLVFSVANGVRKTDEMRQCFGSEPVLGCMANTSGELQSDGSVLFTRNECLHLGALHPAHEEATASLVEAIHDAGVTARCESNIQSIEWTKFCGWVGYMVMAVLTRIPTGSYVSDPGVARLIAQMVQEMAAVAEAEGVEVSDAPLMPVRTIADADLDSATALVVEVGERMHAQAPNHRMSSLQDVLAGRRLEVDGTLGDALERAARHDIAVPVLGMCHALVSAVDKSL